MTLQDAREFVKIIRKEGYKTTPIQEQFVHSIETGKGLFVKGSLTDKQVAWLRSIYAKATELKTRY